MQNLQANATGKVSVETRYTLPSDVPPGADLDKLLPSCPKSQKVTLTSDVGDNAGGAERKYEINGDPSKILGNPDLTGAFLRGDSKQLLELARAGGDVKVTTRTYSMDAMDLPVSLRIEGWGFSSDHRSERRSYSAPAVVVEPRLEG